MNNSTESIVLVGGGGGVYRVAKFLKYSRPKITTIQTTFDHGGHSGDLRDERGVLPPGDIRQAILALADDTIEPTLRELLRYRFPQARNCNLNGATVGNVLLTALTEITGSLPGAISVLCGWYKVRGKVLPVSLDHSELCVSLDDGAVIRGEGLIDTRPIDDNRCIDDAFLEPAANLYDDARQALLAADKIVFCPGDLFTSLIPNVLVKGFKEAVRESKAKKIFVVNAMTKKAETDNFTASDFVLTLLQYLSMSQLDAVIVNNNVFSGKTLENYVKEKSFPVIVDMPQLESLAKQIICEPVAEEVSGIIRHSNRIATVIASL